jgi:hypothetical protein
LNADIVKSILLEFVLLALALSVGAALDQSLFFSNGINCYEKLASLKTTLLLWANNQCGDVNS